MTKKKVAVVSLGCAKNLVDTENMLGLMCESGYEVTTDESQAQILLVNTCGFIESAKEESIQAILNLAQHKKTTDAKLIVAGCLAQRYKDEIMEQMPEIDAIVGTGNIKEIVDVVEKTLKGQRVNTVKEPGFDLDNYIPRVISIPGHSAYVKIAEGCNNRCAYCAIPSIRGKYRSKPMEIIEEEVRELVNGGIVEIILVAQDTTLYGIDLYGDYKLSELLNRLAKIEQLKWLRVMYCYPTHFMDDLIKTIAETPKVCKYIDLPLQHASDTVLCRMNRRGKVQQIKNLIAKIRANIPDVTLRTSFIVGFPGETEEDFAQLLSFMEEIRFDRVGVFKYSLEEDTPAYEMPNQVDEKTKEERYHRAMALQQKISLNKNREKIGRIIEVLVEGEVPDEPGTYVGRSQGDAPEVDGIVYFKAGKKVEYGELVQIKITDSAEYDLMGVLI
ncbi:30S ribosomal protein S12 methylthiotransferase RimO [Desulfofalx alkaliphila]|uniref:30S ribosomal protein S12 methylthiotransferase RimO n=1 Tax=Desulfofalx alkaliphila TaxID=105483 RepID=UPI0004E1A0D1|nr:30S ribosomal protein S12 methylthiotransferase RimO [Desulfofalx alkaliphila]